MTLYVLFTYGRKAERAQLLLNIIKMCQISVSYPERDFRTSIII